MKSSEAPLYTTWNILFVEMVKASTRGRKRSELEAVLADELAKGLNGTNIESIKAVQFYASQLLNKISFQPESLPAIVGSTLPPSPLVDQSEKAQAYLRERFGWEESTRDYPTMK